MMQPDGLSTTGSFWVQLSVCFKMHESVLGPCAARKASPVMQATLIYRGSPQHSIGALSIHQGLRSLMPALRRPMPEFPCDVCNVVAASEGDLAAHLDGKRHRKHLQMAEVLADSAGAEGAPGSEAPAGLHCQLCDVTAPTHTHKELHLM